MAADIVADLLAVPPPGPPLAQAGFGIWLLLLILLLGAAALLYEAYRHGRHMPDAVVEDDDLPMLVFPLDATGAGIPQDAGPGPRRTLDAPRPHANGPTTARAVTAPGDVLPGVAAKSALRNSAPHALAPIAFDDAAQDGGASPAAVTVPAADASPAAVTAPAADASPAAVTVPDAAAPPAAMPGRPPFAQPAPDGTLQLLPGRLEVMSGLDQRGDIRFVKAPGREATITFGRSPGDPPAHIQLPAPTVSSMHAAMRFHGGAWFITNLSRTNPVVVNGAELGGGSGAGAGHALKDGDQVEMGEVVFRFRGR
jgi:hypothetical protein